MSWLRRYRIRAFFRSSFWIVPAFALFCAIGSARLMRAVDDRYHWIILDFTPEGAKAILGGVVSSMLTFVVVVASSLLLVVQLVSAGLTPRIIASTFQRPLIRLSLSVFVFSFVLSVSVLGRIGNTVPQLAVTAAILWSVVSVILFLYFVGSVGMGLRPSEIMSSTAAAGRKVIFDIYPTAYDQSDADAESCLATSTLGQASSVIAYEGISGVVLAFDRAGIVELAKQHRAIIEMVPRVGDFVTLGDTLFRVYGSDSVAHRRLQKMVALGPERTLEQDPRFAFRIIVDIACKALSPAINDPTTAVLAIDQIHRLLRWVGGRKLLSGRQADAAGATRLVFSTPSWEDFVWHGTIELRHYGGDSVRVCQRLRAMLEHLMRVLPEARRGPLQEQLRLLNQAVERNFAELEDRNRVGVGSAQLNGASADA